MPDGRSSISKRFGRYKDEDEKAVRNQQVRSNPAVEAFVLAWKKYEFSPNCYPSSYENHDAPPGLICKEYHYENALALVRDIPNSANDIQAIIVAIGAFQHEEDFGEKAGMLLSALMNSSPEHSLTITTRNLGVKPDGLGYRNVKKIVVEGDVGYGIGCFMQDGELIVNGRAGHDAGLFMHGGRVIIKGDTGPFPASCMLGGELIIEGNAQHCPGSEMSGGSVIIKGDVTENLGWWMDGGSITVFGNAGRLVGGEGMYALQGGTLYLMGDYISFDQVKSGKIYHKGKLIVDK